MLGLGITLIICAVIALIALTAMSKANPNSESLKKGKKFFVGLAVIGLLAGVGLSYVGLNSQTFQRSLKNMESNYTGGINRKITVVNQEGKVIKEYSGKMDIEENSGEKLTFILDGKKYIIYNSVLNTIYVEEY